MFFRKYPEILYTKVSDKLEYENIADTDQTALVKEQFDYSTKYLNPCHAELIQMPLLLRIVSQLVCLIKVGVTNSFSK